jgi:hypothetical protein
MCETQFMEKAFISIRLVIVSRPSGGKQFLKVSQDFVAIHSPRDRSRLSYNKRLSKSGPA